MPNRTNADPSGPQEVQHSRQNGREDDPEQWEPVKEGYPDEGRVNAVVERRIQQHNKRDEQEDSKPDTPSRRSLGLGLRTHKVSPFALETDKMERNEMKPTGKTGASK